MTQLVAGVDSSTQSVKIVIRNAETGELIREGRAAHPDGTEVDPEKWWSALNEAIAQAGGLSDVAAIAIGGQGGGDHRLVRSLSKAHGGPMMPRLTARRGVIRIGH